MRRAPGRRQCTPPGGAGDADGSDASRSRSPGSAAAPADPRRRRLRAIGSGATSRPIATGDGHHLAEPDDAARLDQIEVGARFERVLTQRRVRLRGQHDRDRVAATRLGPEGADQRNAAFRHHQLDDDHVRRLGPRRGERGASRRGGGDRELPLGQPQLVELARIRMPFDEQHAGRRVADRDSGRPRAGCAPSAGWVAKVAPHEKRSRAPRENPDGRRISCVTPGWPG